jgi:hypothetical protein
VTIDRTGTGVRHGLMPERNDVFGYNLSRSSNNPLFFSSPLAGC